MLLRIPNAIILPNSITSFISPKVSDQNAGSRWKQLQKNTVQTCAHKPFNIAVLKSCFSFNSFILASK